MLWETVRLALTAIRRNVLRSFLTVLGVVIGVAAVIAMVTVGQGSSQQVAASVESLGTNVLIVRPGTQIMGPGARNSAPPFKLADVAALEDLPALEAVAPVVTTSETAVFGNMNRMTSVTGTTAAYLDIGGWELARGRSFTSVEDRTGANVCIIGETLRAALFGATDPTGEKIRLKAISCEVIGLLVAKGAGSFGQDQDDIVIMPVRTVQRRLLGSQDVSTIMMQVAPGVSSERAIGDIQALLRERRRISLGEDDNFAVMDMKELATMLNSVNTVLTGLLSSVAAVSLLVGGIGIMNIMLANVTERTPRDRPAARPWRAAQRRGRAVPTRGAGDLRCGGLARAAVRPVARLPDRGIRRLAGGVGAGAGAAVGGVLRGGGPGLRRVPGAPSVATGPDRGVAPRLSRRQARPAAAPSIRSGVRRNRRPSASAGGSRPPRMFTCNAG